MKPTFKLTATGIGVLAAVVLASGAFVAFERASQQRLVPAKRASTLSEFLDWQPACDTFAKINVGSKRHIIAYGPLCGWLPSGPSAYVFDDTGRLVDWSSDIGDSPSFDKKWGAQQSRGSATLHRSDVKRLVQERAGR